MRAVIQRVTRASVTVDGAVTGEIGLGLLIFLGVAQGDTEEECDRLAEKIVKLRIFSDENGKTNLSVRDVGGRILAVSQFTLCADLKGNRPSFSKAEGPERANELYERFCRRCGELLGSPTEKGVFGADMKVSIENDGPFTIMI